MAADERWEHMLDNAYKPVGIADADLRIAHALEYIAGHVGRISARLGTEPMAYKPNPREVARAVLDLLREVELDEASPDMKETAEQLKILLGEAAKQIPRPE